MKKKTIAAILMTVTLMALSLTGCGERTDLVDKTVVADDGETQTSPEEDSTVSDTPTEESMEDDTKETPEAQNMTESTTEGETEQSETQTEQLESEEVEEPIQLSEGELRARREQQENFAEARQTLYSLPNSIDKTTQINQMDRQILDNNAFNFRGKNVVFIGDSITEGITSAIDQNGNRVSYVTYANSYLHFNSVLNHGIGGRMFSTYGGDELSLDKNFGNVTNIGADVIVVFAGVNDYLSTPENKRFGNIDDQMSTAGYCGAVRSFMKQLKEYYGDRDIFFVTMYNTSKIAVSTYSDVEGQLTLNDYMEVQRKLAKDYGFNVIELYDIGMMDCSSVEASNRYLRDGLHPNDTGNIILGEHIAAELSLYFGRKEVDN